MVLYKKTARCRERYFCVLVTKWSGYKAHFQLLFFFVSSVPGSLLDQKQQLVAAVGWRTLQNSTGEVGVALARLFWCVDYSNFRVQAKIGNTTTTCFGQRMW